MRFVMRFGYDRDESCVDGRLVPLTAKIGREGQFVIRLLLGYGAAPIRDYRIRQGGGDRGEERVNK